MTRTGEFYDHTAATFGPQVALDNLIDSYQKRSGTLPELCRMPKHWLETFAARFPHIVRMHNSAVSFEYRGARIMTGVMWTCE